jgi:hypothetical protein
VRIGTGGGGAGGFASTISVWIGSATEGGATGAGARARIAPTATIASA